MAENRVIVFLSLHTVFRIKRARSLSRSLARSLSLSSTLSQLHHELFVSCIILTWFVVYCVTYAFSITTCTWFLVCDILVSYRMFFFFFLFPLSVTAFGFLYVIYYVS